MLLRTLIFNVVRCALEIRSVCFIEAVLTIQDTNIELALFYWLGRTHIFNQLNCTTFNYPVSYLSSIEHHHLVASLTITATVVTIAIWLEE